MTVSTPRYGMAGVVVKMWWTIVGYVAGDIMAMFISMYGVPGMVAER